jgi:hypothetical protein
MIIPLTTNPAYFLQESHAGTGRFGLVFSVLFMVGMSLTR